MKATINNSHFKIVSIPKWFEMNDLLTLGWIRVYSIGSENMYFEYSDKGHVYKGFIKIQ